MHVAVAPDQGRVDTVEGPNGEKLKVLQFRDGNSAITIGPFRAEEWDGFLKLLNEQPQEPKADLVVAGPGALQGLPKMAVPKGKR